MKKIIYPYSIFIVLLGLTVAANVFAIGSGSGGSAGTAGCTQSTWNCGDWSSCSTSGTQIRNCTETFSCPTANTPMPAMSESCAPPPRPPVTSGPAPAPQSAGIAPPSVPPACASSTWQCSAWSAACDIYGEAHRTCKLVADCPASPTPSPSTAQACTHLQCGNLATVHDRIACRLNLAPEGVAQDLRIQYLPEECRVMTDATEKQDCILRYKSFQPCWNLPAGDGRFACAEQALHMGTSSIADDLAACQAKGGVAQTSCEQTLKENTLYMIKFRFYDLEQRAEDLARRGVGLGAVVNLETTIETQKQAFDSAQTKAQYAQIILDVRSAWQNFISQVKDEVH